MTTQVQTNKTKQDILSIGSILAFVALLTAITVFIIAAIVPKLGALPYLMLIKDLGLIGAVAIPAYAFVSSKSKVFKIIYWVCVAVVAVAAIFGNMQVI